jgi:hypothetical protein
MHLAATQQYAGAMQLTMIRVTRAFALCARPQTSSLQCVTGNLAEKYSPLPSRFVPPAWLIFSKLLKHIACLGSRNDTIGIGRQQ